MSERKSGWLAAASRHISAVLVVAILSGCATFENSKPIPEQTKAVSIAVLDEDISAWSDMPIGAYRIPESQVVISGHQRGGIGMLLFGVVGVALAHAGESGAAAGLVKDAERTLKMRIAPTVDRTVRERLRDGRYASKIEAMPGARDSSVQVVPALVITKITEQEFLPFLVLKVTLPGQTPSKPQWTTRYIAGLGKPRPLLGDGSWTADNGAALKETLRIEAERATQVMLEDISTPLPRAQGDLMMVQANHAFAAARFQTTGHILLEDETSIVYIPKLGDIIVFTGVNVLDKANIIYRVATKDDLPFTIVAPTPSK